MDPDKSQNNNVVPASGAGQISGSLQQDPVAESQLGLTQSAEPSTPTSQLNQQPSGVNPLQQAQPLSGFGVTRAVPQGMQDSVQSTTVQQSMPPSQGVQSSADPLTSTPIGGDLPQTAPGAVAQDASSINPVASMPQRPVSHDVEPPTTVNSTAALLGNVDPGLSAPKEGDDPLSKIEAAQQEQTLDSTNPLGLQTPDPDVVGLAQSSPDTAAADISSPSNMTTSDEEAGSSGKNY